MQTPHKVMTMCFTAGIPFVKCWVLFRPSPLGCLIRAYLAHNTYHPRLLHRSCFLLITVANTLYRSFPRIIHKNVGTTLVPWCASFFTDSESLSKIQLCRTSIILMRHPPKYVYQTIRVLNTFLNIVILTSAAMISMSDPSLRD